MSDGLRIGGSSVLMTEGDQAAPITRTYSGGTISVTTLPPSNDPPPPSVLRMFERGVVVESIGCTPSPPCPGGQTCTTPDSRDLMSRKALVLSDDYFSPSATTRTPHPNSA